MKSQIGKLNSRQALVHAVAIFTLISAGCASSRGFNRGTLRETLRGSVESRAVVDDAQIAKVLQLKAQLPKPFKVAVYFTEPATVNYRPPQWRWAESDKTEIMKLADSLKAIGEISDVVIMNPDTTTGEDLKALRLAAARHGAHALLVVSGVKDVDTYANNWAWTYVALLPMLFVNGTDADVLFMARATLWDVRNEFLYMSAEGEGLNKQKGPVGLMDDKLLIEKAKVEAVARLSTEISSQIKEIAATSVLTPKSATK